MSRSSPSVLHDVPDVFGVIEACQQSESVADLVSTIGPSFRQLGATNFAYGQATDSRGGRAPAVQFGVRNSQWAAHYVERNLVAKDGMYPRTLRSAEPFSWAGLKGAGFVEPDGLEVLEQARAFSLRDGFVVPIHHLNGASAAVLLSGDTVLDWSPKQTASAHLLAIYFASIGIGLTSALAIVRKPALSRRQRECLQWVRAGKTDWEIAQILGLSEHTVVEYVEGARRRLGVRTRAQAVIEGITQGLITV